jgi:glycosyltransferase involved in cell wall biosynthesis
MLTALVSEARDVEVVCASRAWPAPDPFECDGVRYVTLPSGPPEGGWRGVLENWSIRVDDATLEIEMRRLIAHVRPDLIHLHGTEDPHALAVLHAAGTTPVLVSVQGPQSEYLAHFYEGFPPKDLILDVASLQFIRGGGLVQPWRRMRRAAVRELETLAEASDVSGRTDWDRDVVLRANPSARYWHIDELLREPFYETSWRGPAQGEQTIVVVTRAWPLKGIDVILRAFARVRDRHTCRLKVVGQIEGTPLWPSLRRLEGRLGLTGHVDWVGSRGAAEVAEMLSACSVAVCPSRIENSPNSVCEAMLVGAPVVASRAGGIPSLVTHEEDGLLFAVGDDQALANAVLRVLNDDNLARELGTRARQTASARHDQSAVAQRMLDVYAALMSGARE